MTVIRSKNYGFTLQHDPKRERLNKGADAEDRFENIALNHFGTVIRTKDKADKNHIDFYIHEKGQQYTVDVKSKCPVVGWVTIELQNCHGKPGWLYGNTDYIAFEMSEGFILVWLNDIIPIVKEKVDMNTYVNCHADAKYKLYSRKKFGNDDIITLIQIYDLMNIWHRKLACFSGQNQHL